MIKEKIINTLGMELLEVTYKNVVANFGYDDDWITLYSIASSNPNKGEAQELLKLVKDKYKHKAFAGTVALNPTMKHIYKKMDIKEYA